MPLALVCAVVLDGVWGTELCRPAYIRTSGIWTELSYVRKHTVSNERIAVRDRDIESVCNQQPMA